MSNLKWQHRTNKHGWRSIWSTPDGPFEIQQHIGDSAHNDYGVMTGKPYSLMRAELCEPDEDGDNVCWHHLGRFATLDAARAKAEAL
jgi:hypothetical protein